jgi:hypothetical protein
MKFKADCENRANWLAGKEFSVAEAVDKPVEQIRSSRNAASFDGSALPWS